jgi:aspartyl-tRNA(Asn)/glutamyl-tRNA(Gln) amidotransferase subunit B
MKYQPVIGLEIHIQAKTKSKMFCSCSSEYFGAQPNTHVCPVCLGLPGALPVPNAKAIEQSLKLSLALNCDISSPSKFDRKNYFYPDLPKAYQISQYDQPIGKNGHIGVLLPSGQTSHIRIRRVHQEEDTGKSIHEGGVTLLDYNKSGVPLIEVVTEPDFKTLEEVTAFAKLLKQTVQYLGVSDAEMQKGQMRFELNISLRQESDGDNLPNYRIEVKNIGSISVLEKVMEFEIARQSQALDNGEALRNETRGLKDMTGETALQRRKENEDDYRYFPEPDIPPFTIDAERIAQVKSELPELPAARQARYMQTLGLDYKQSETLVDQDDKGDLVDDVWHNTQNDIEATKIAAKLMLGEVAYQLEANQISLVDSIVQTDDLIYLAKMQLGGQLSSTLVKQVVGEMFASNRRAEAIVTEDNLAIVQDAGQLEEWVDKAIAENPKVIESLAKNPNAAKSLIGVVMRESKGQANPTQVEELIKQKLGLN